MRSPLQTLVLIVTGIIALVCAELENTAVVRTVDLSSQLLRDSIQVSVTNVGTSPISEYVLPIENPHEVAFLQIKNKKPSTVIPHKLSDDGKTATFSFDPILQPGDKANFVISFVRTHVFKPYPKEVAQNDKQQFKYIANPLFYSEYPTLKTRTSYLFPNEEVTYTGEGLSLTSNKVTFGPYSTKVSPHSTKQAEFHYTNNARFLTTERLLRTLEVSHWGNNLAYEEFYDVVHDGAKLKGHYSRLDFDRFNYNHQNTAVIKNINFNLPVGASDAYYRDIIGNISTSRFRSSPFESVLELVPRYPLFGGWKTKWYHGYNVPLSNSLQKASDGTYILNFLFVAPYEEVVIDEFTLQVTLPEGATDIKFHSEHDLGIEESFDVVKTYLDTYGRPVVRISRRNVVNDHQVPVQISYKYPSYLLLQEPLLLTGFFFLLFLTAIFVVRIDLSIAKDPKTERRERARSHWLDVIEIEEAKKEIFAELDDALAVFRADKNAEAHEVKRKAAEKKIQSANEQLKSAQSALKNIDPSLAGKVEELKTLGEEKWNKTMRGHNECVTSKGAKKTEDLYKEVVSLDKRIENILSSQD